MDLLLLLAFLKLGQDHLIFRTRHIMRIRMIWPEILILYNGASHLQNSSSDHHTSDFIRILSQLLLLAREHTTSRDHMQRQEQ